MCCRRRWRCRRRGNQSCACSVAVGSVGVVVAIGVVGLFGCEAFLCCGEPSRVVREIVVVSVHFGWLETRVDVVFPFFGCRVKCNCEKTQVPSKGLVVSCRRGHCDRLLEKKTDRKKQKKNLTEIAQVEALRCTPTVRHPPSWTMTGEDAEPINKQIEKSGHHFREHTTQAKNLPTPLPEFSQPHVGLRCNEPQSLSCDQNQRVTTLKRALHVCFVALLTRCTGQSRHVTLQSLFSRRLASAHVPADNLLMSCTTKKDTQTETDGHRRRTDTRTDRHKNRRTHGRTDTRTHRQQDGQTDRQKRTDKNLGRTDTQRHRLTVRTQASTNKPTNIQTCTRRHNQPHTFVH